jgi:hypothetical protein
MNETIGIPTYIKWLFRCCDFDVHKTLFLFLWVDIIKLIKGSYRYLDSSH